jgi:hypothetical protein
VLHSGLSTRHRSALAPAGDPLRLVGVSVLPEPLEPIRRQGRVAHRRGDRVVAKVVVDLETDAARLSRIIVHSLAGGPHHVFARRAMPIATAALK